MNETSQPAQPQAINDHDRLQPRHREIESVADFHKLLSIWHENRVARVKHLLDIPDGAEIQVGEGENSQQLILTGDVRASFLVGVHLALNELGHLPFYKEQETDGEQSQETQAEAEAVTETSDNEG